MSQNINNGSNCPEFPDSSKRTEKDRKDMIARAPPAPYGRILMYNSEDGSIHVEAVFSEDDIWLSQSGMAELYQVNVRTVNEHVGNILRDGELDDAVVRTAIVPRMEGERIINRQVTYYSLRMILAVGYRVRNHIGAHFRNWASSVLSEYMQKGFALDERRLKNPKDFGTDYFDELLERIRDIRSSEKRLYKKVLDIYALSADYDPSAETSREFFATVQNKLHYAASGKTAAELRYERIDGGTEHCGLTAWEGNAPRKKDLDVAKNFMTEEELKNLNGAVSAFLEFAEMRARNRIPTYMSDWVKILDDLMQMGGRKVLTGKGSVSKEMADSKADEEYTKYSKRMLAAASKGEKDYMEFLETRTYRMTAAEKDDVDGSDAPSKEGHTVR
ncbi:MAG: virulence RhuM family protein [Methanomassiliicoccaceae archaeon]|nr:virulence RhuM family protein [Methanomassiliicoccaceae archaeon]